MKQKALVTGIIVVAAIAFIAIIAYLSQYSSYKNLVAEKVKVEKELNKTKGVLDKANKALDESNKAREEDQKTITSLRKEILQIKKAQAEEAKIVALEQTINKAIVWEGKGAQDAVGAQTSNKKEIDKYLVLAGFLDPKTGREVRLRGKGGNISLPLIRDEKGNVTGIAKYKRGTDGKFNHVITRKLAPDIKSAKFLGDIKGGVQSDEYVYKRK
jgi:Skp family chaperone for outer membrane proteins